jgi:mycofactocin system glycosyltransferase
MPRARVVRHPVARGPAAARNSGLAKSATPYVAFVDSDVVLAPQSARRLLGHLADPCVGAVAPRVRGLHGGGAGAGGGERNRGGGFVAGYEQRHSALDMGAVGGLVAPGRATAYVPSTVLVARRGALGAGFDESLRSGEDVDLVWRLCRAGWRVRYVPEVEVWHDHPRELRAFLARRRQYARSTAGLARRHPEALPALWVSPPLLLPWLLALSGRRRAALAVAAGATLRLGHRLPIGGGLRYRLAAANAGRGLALTGLGLAHAGRRAWSPALLPLALCRPRWRAGLAAALAVPIVLEGVAAREHRALLGDVPLRLLEEAVAALAIWEGCARERTLRPLLPAWRSPERTAA